MNQTTMRAILLTGHGDYDKLEYREDVAIPQPAPHQVLLRIRACGLNNTDINTRTAWYSKSDNPEDAAWGGSSIAFPLIQGADAVGEVIAVGDDADTSLLHKRALIDVWIRDPDDPLDMNKCRYFGSEVDGGYAEYAVVDYRNVFPIESDLSNEELATFATSYVTAENMLDRAQVAAGDTVLIPGASGGVGSALIQLVKRRGATAIAMAGEDKHDQVQAVGPDALLPRSPDDLGAALQTAIGKDTIDVVADVVGGPLFPAFIEALGRGGRYTCSGAIAGPIVDLDLRSMYLKDLTFTGATVVPPGTFGRLVKYIEDGEIRPLLAKVFPLKDLVKAQRMFVAKQHVGNIAVTMQSD